MDSTTRDALQDLLTVQALSEIQPVQVQRWQQAARVVLGVADVKDAKDAATVGSVRSFGKKKEGGDADPEA